MLGDDIWHVIGKDGDVLVIGGVGVGELYMGFVNKVRRGNTSFCWNWRGSLNDSGYGVMYAYRGRQKTMIRAHRLSWVMANASDVPDGKMILHGCDNRRCVNPHHLRVGTAKDNAWDAIDRGRFVGYVRHGEDNLKAKLTWDTVRAIRARHAAGSVTYDELGREYGVHAQTVGRIVRGVIWKPAS